MKLVQLLTGAAAAALLAGASFAQTDTVGAGGDFDGDERLASENGSALAGDLVIAHDFGADFAPLGTGATVRMTISLTNARFTGTIADTAYSNANQDAECDFGSVVAGGGAQGDSVTFENTDADLYFCGDAGNATDGGAGAGTSNLGTTTLPIEVVTVGEPVSATVTYARVAGSTNYTAPAAQTLDLVEYADATGFTFTSGTASDLLVTGTTLIDWSAIAVAGDAGRLGSFAADALPAGGDAVQVGINGGAALTDYDTVLDDVNEIVFTFEDVTNFTNITPSAGVCTAPNATENTITCTLTGAQVNTSVGAGVTFDLVLSATEAVVAPQTVGVEFTADPITNYTIGGASDADFATIDEDDGVFTQVIAAEFPWSSLRTTGGAKSAFRITGLEASPSAINVILNSTYVRDGGTAPTESTVDITSVADIQEDPLNAGEYIASFTSEGIASVLGTDGGVNADIQFSVVLEDGTATGSLEVLRLLSTGGVVAGTAFDG